MAIRIFKALGCGFFAGGLVNDALSFKDPNKLKQSDMKVAFIVGSSFTVVAFLKGPKRILAGTVGALAITTTVLDYTVFQIGLEKIKVLKEKEPS